MTTVDEDLAILQRLDPRAFESLLEAQDLRNDMPRYMRWAWPIDPSHSKPLDWNFHLDAKCEYLKACRAGEITRLVINEPPRCLKSWTVSVAFPSHWWASDPSVQFLVTSAAIDVVHRDADALRDLCASPEYQRMFRPKWDFRAGATSKQQDAKGYYRNSAGGHRISKALGAKSQGDNTDVLIFDDPLDAADAFTDKASLAQHVVHAQQTFIPRLNDHETGIVIVIMQRLHGLDLSGVFLEQGGWEHLYLPAEFDGKRVWSVIGWEDPRTEIGELLDPKRLPQKLLDERKVTLGARGYAGQYQQQPAPAEGAMLLKEWLEHYWTPGELPQFDCWWSSWDCSFGSKTSDADFVVGQVWACALLDSILHAYLLDQVRRKMTVPQMIAALREQNRLYPNMRAVVIEKQAAGKHVIEAVAHEIHGVEPFNPHGQSKEERLSSTLPMWEQGRVHLPHPQLASQGGYNYDWIRTVYVPELLAFPGARHDDQVDASSQALIWLRNNGPGEITMKILG